MSEAFPIVISVPAEEAGKRLDQLLVAQLDVSRARVQQLIAEAKVLVNDTSPKASLKLRGGERITVLGSASRPPLRAIAEETSGQSTHLEPLAKAVLRAAREMTVDLRISDETFAALQRELDNERLTDLVVAIAFYNGLVRLLETMQVDVEEDHLPYLEEFPLPKA